MHRTNGNLEITPVLYISGCICVKLEETGTSKIIVHMVDLKELFPDIDIENL